MRACLLLAAALGLAGVVAFFMPTDPPKAASTADPVWRSGTFSLQLTDHPCQHEDLRLILEEQGIPPAKRSISTSPGMTLSGCYTRDMAGDILNMDHTSSAENIAIPAGWFRR